MFLGVNVCLRLTLYLVHVTVGFEVQMHVNSCLLPILQTEYSLFAPVCALNNLEQVPKLVLIIVCSILAKICYMMWELYFFLVESSSYKGNVNCDPSREKDVGDTHDCIDNSTANKRGKLYDTRYFIIKSLNHQNIQLSIEKGIWATQVMNEPILEEAFHVRFLIFQYRAQLLQSRY